MSRHKTLVRQKQVELRALLLDWDPIGIGSDGPRDEYDCLLGLVGRLRGGAGVAALEAFLADELSNHFGLDPKAARLGDFAAKLHEWYWADPLPGSLSKT